MSDEKIPTEIVGRTVEHVELRNVESEAEDREVLRIEFTDGFTVEIGSQDYEGYRSWLVIQHPE